MSFLDDTIKWREEVRSIVGNNQAGWMMADISSYLDQLTSELYFGEITYECMHALFGRSRNVDLKTNPYCQKVFNRWVDQGLLEFTYSGISVKKADGSFKTPANFIM